MFAYINPLLPQYTFDQLVLEVQASENEILKGLKNMQACLIDGNY